MAFDPRQFSAEELSAIMGDLNEDELTLVAGMDAPNATVASQFGTAAFRGARDLIGGYPGAIKAVGDWMQAKPSTAPQNVLNPNLPVAGALDQIRRYKPVQEAMGTIGGVLSKAGGAAQKWITQPMPGLEPQKYDFKEHPIMELSRIAGGAAPSLIATYGGTGLLSRAAGLAKPVAALAAGTLSQYPQQMAESYQESVGKGLSPDQAMGKANVVAALVSAIESLPATKWIEGYGGTNRLIKSLKGAIIEGSEEVVQAGVSLVSRLTEAKTEQDALNALSQFSQEAKEGFAGGAMLGGVAGAVSPYSREEYAEDIRKTITKEELARGRKEVNVMGTKQTISTTNPEEIARKVYNAQVARGYYDEKGNRVQSEADFIKRAGPIVEKINLVRSVGVPEDMAFDVIENHGVELQDIVDAQASGLITPEEAGRQALEAINGRSAAIDYAGVYGKVMEKRTAAEYELASFGTIESNWNNEAKKRVKELKAELAVPVPFQKVTVNGKDIYVATTGTELGRAYQVAMQLGNADEAQKVVDRMVANPAFKDPATGKIKRLLTASDLKKVGDITAPQFGVGGPILYVAVRYKNIVSMSQDGHFQLGFTYNRSQTDLSRDINPLMGNNPTDAIEITYATHDGKTGTVAKGSSIHVPAGVRIIVCNTFDEGPTGGKGLFYRIDGSPKALTYNADEKKRGTVANVYDTLVHEIAHETYGHSQQSRFMADYKRSRKGLFVKIQKVVGKATEVAIEYRTDTGQVDTVVVKGQKALLAKLEALGEKVQRIGILAPMTIIGPDGKPKTGIPRQVVYGDVVSSPEHIWSQVKETIPYQLHDSAGQEQFSFGEQPVAEATEASAPTAKGGELIHKSALPSNARVGAGGWDVNFATSSKHYRTMPARIVGEQGEYWIVQPNDAEELQKLRDYGGGHAITSTDIVTKLPTPSGGAQGDTGGTGLFDTEAKSKSDAAVDKVSQQNVPPGSTPPPPPPNWTGPGGKTIPQNFNPFDLEHIRILNGMFAWGSNNGRDFARLWEEHIGTTFRISPMLRRFLGVYYSNLDKNGRIVVKDLRMLRTICHEVGHFIDDYFAKSRGLIRVPRSWNHPVRQELIAISTEMRGVMTQGDSYRNSRAELVADFFSMHVLDEAKARSMAPEFYRTVIDPLIQNNPEFTYIAAKLREIEEQLGPIKEFVNALEPVKKFTGVVRDITKVHHKGTWLEFILPWERRIKYYERFRQGFDRMMNSSDFLKSFTEKGGTTDQEFGVFYQHRKLIAGAIAAMKEEISDPMRKLDSKTQQKVAETLQQWKERYGNDPNHPLYQLTEKTRTELARWANALREIGLLSDITFWNNVGRYFPYMYTEKELAGHQASPYTKKIQADIKATTKMFKQRLTNVQFSEQGVAALMEHAPLTLAKLLHSMWPERFASVEHMLSMDEATVSYTAVRSLLDEVLTNRTSPAYSPLTRDDQEVLGMRMRDDMGLIKTAAYPIHKRLSQMIKTYYKVQLCNALAAIPTVMVKNKYADPKNTVHMSNTKTNGGLADTYIRKDVFDMLQGTDEATNALIEAVQMVNAFWKTAKVPGNPGSYVTNTITNLIMMYINDIPVFTHPAILARGLAAFNKNSVVYKALRDAGLYHHNYGEAELAMMATLADRYKNDGRAHWAKVMEWSSKPGQLYGKVEDFAKTVIANYYVEKGYSVDEAIKAADKILFDYSSISRATKIAKGSFIPFATWSMKVAPRIVENVFLRPEKFISMMGVFLVMQALLRSMFDVDDEEEKKTRPDYMRGPTHMVLVVGRDKRGNPIYLDLDKYMPWGTWQTRDFQGIPVPQAITPGGVPVSLLGAWMFNRDSFGQDIAKDWMTPGQRRAALANYMYQQLAPEWAGRGGVKLVEAALGIPTRPGEEPQGFGTQFLKTAAGVPTGKTTDMSRASGLDYAKRNMQSGISALKKQYATKRISREQLKAGIEVMVRQYRKYVEEHGR